MSKKALIIGIVVVLLVAIGTTTVLFLIKNNTASNQTKLIPNGTTPDLSVDYGACDLLSTDTIKSILGLGSDNLFAGFDTGKGSSGGGDSAQNCVYGFKDKVIVISNDMLLDTFYTTVYIFGDDARKDAARNVYDSGDVILGLGDKAAFFEKSGETLDYTNYEVRVGNGLLDYSFSIRQSKDSTLFTSASAKSKLTELAKSVDYTKFENTK